MEKPGIPGITRISPINKIYNLMNNYPSLPGGIFFISNNYSAEMSFLLQAA
jgi:hypothetical protein